jgi:hypothetical protein
LHFAFFRLCWSSHQFSSVAAAVVCYHQQLQGSLTTTFKKTSYSINHTNLNPAGYIANRKNSRLFPQDIISIEMKVFAMGL